MKHLYKVDFESKYATTKTHKKTGKETTSVDWLSDSMNLVGNGDAEGVIEKAKRRTIGKKSRCSDEVYRYRDVVVGFRLSSIHQGSEIHG